jgi:hypothetical protein
MWYCERDGAIKLFNSEGFYPVTGKPLRIKSKCCGEILNFDICILKIDTNARFL